MGHQGNDQRHGGNARLWNARWQQTYQVNFHWCRSSEHAHFTENNGFTGKSAATYKASQKSSVDMWNGLSCLWFSNVVFSTLTKTADLTEWSVPPSINLWSPVISQIEATPSHEYNVLLSFTKIIKLVLRDLKLPIRYNEILFSRKYLHSYFWLSLQ